MTKKYEKVLKWTKEQKWLLPLGCGGLMIMAAAAMALCFVSGFARLERDCQREVGSWEELKTPESLNRALIRHGLDMGAANPGEQVVNMTTAGLPAPGQTSVARLRARRGSIDRMVLNTRPATSGVRRKNTVRR